MELTAQHFSAIQELTDIIGKHPHAYLKLEKSYGAPPTSSHADAIAQAIHLAGTHQDFEARLQAEIEGTKGFHWGKGWTIFAAIVTGGASLIPELAIKAAMKAAAAKKAAAQQQAQAAGQSPAQVAAAGTAAAADPVATAAATNAATQQAAPGPGGKQAAPPPAASKTPIIIAVVAGIIFVCTVAYFIFRKPKEVKP